MEILTRTELRVRFSEILEKINEGSIFIYPTDTIYGIGCSALNDKAVQQIREIKGGRSSAPFSIIVPSINWVKKNCTINQKGQKWLEKLPGPYTIILPLKNRTIAENIAPNVETIGIRYLDHWFSEVVAKLGIPIVTTSANKTGEPFMTSLENLDPEIENSVEFIIYEGPKEGRPSRLINVEKDEILER